jgi:hypothetical protein
MRYAWILLASGCSALTSTDPIPPLGSGDGGPPGRFDAGPLPSDLDAGPVTPGTDAGPGPACDEGARCAGNVLVVCEGGMELRTPCGELGCGGDPPSCNEPECDPGLRECDGDSLLTCADGRLESVPCEFGCDAAIAECAPPPPDCDAIDTLRGGGNEFDTCEFTDTTTPRATDDCDDGANGRDIVRRLVIDRDRFVRLSLREDSEGDMDTVVYVRRACDDPEGQIACADDDRCLGCPGGVDVGESTINTFLERGVYFVYIDTYDYTASGRTFGCGPVRLDVALL